METPLLVVGADADAAKNHAEKERSRAEKERSRANDDAVDRLKFIIKNIYNKYERINYYKFNIIYCDMYVFLLFQ